MRKFALGVCAIALMPVALALVPFLLIYALGDSFEELIRVYKK